MTNLKTKVINLTKYEITVKEGNAGIFSKLQTLAPWQGTTTKPDSCKIEVDQNATFREYWMVLPPEHQNLPKIIVTSDDCVDSKEIKISYDDAKRIFSTEKIERGRNAKRNAAGNGIVVTDQVNNNGAVAMVNLGGSTNPDNQPETLKLPAIAPVTPPAVQEGKHGIKVKWTSRFRNFFTR
jgi:hypothetical protein